MKQQPSEVDSPRKTLPGWRRLAVRVGLAAAAAVMLVPLSAAANAAPGDVQPDIIGGNPPTQAYPAGALVSLKYDAPAHNREAWHTCGAALMDGIHLRTAAHCVTDPPAASSEQKAKLARYFGMDAATLSIPVKDKSFWVRVGSTNKDKGGIVARVKVKWVHKDWNWAMTPGAEVDDVAVLEAEQYIDTYGLPLAPRKAEPEDEVYELGWGSTRLDGKGPLPTHVRELKTKIVSSRNCDPAGITTREVCADNPNQTDGVCYGDSGGPIVIVINGVLYDAGITSRMATQWCGADPTVYTSTPEFRKELYDVMRGTPVPPKAQKPPTVTVMTMPPERPAA